MEISEQELAGTYAGMEDGDLVELARSRADLTERAQSVLLGELKRRGLTPPEPSLQAKVEQGVQAWVTVARFRDMSAAIVARSALEAAGVECFLRDENLVRMDWQISNFIGGMRLDVLQADVDAAHEVLAGLPSEDEPASDTGAMLSSERCPNCGSGNIRREARRRGLSLAALLLIALPIPTGPEEWQCGNCGHRWQDE